MLGSCKNSRACDIRFTIFDFTALVSNYTEKISCLLFLLKYRPQFHLQNFLRNWNDDVRSFSKAVPKRETSKTRIVYVELDLHGVLLCGGDVEDSGHGQGVLQEQLERVRFRHRRVQHRGNHRVHLHQQRQHRRPHHPQSTQTGQYTQILFIHNSNPVPNMEPVSFTEKSNKF